MAENHRRIALAPENNHPVQDMPKPGMALVAFRGVYKHFAIYIGKNDYGKDCVIHYNDNSTNGKGRVEPSTLEQFVSGCAWDIAYYKDEGIKKYSDYTDQVCRDSLVRAFACLGEEEYHIILNNCEHIASWCVTGISRSKQVEERIAQLLPYIKEAAERGWDMIKNSFKKNPVLTAAICVGVALFLAGCVSNYFRDNTRYP